VTSWLAKCDKIIDVSRIGPVNERAWAAVLTMLPARRVSVFGREFSAVGNTDN
jgi:hypothetical protein